MEKVQTEYDEYIITSQDKEERYFVHQDGLEAAKKIYKRWSGGESALECNTRIYKVIDITDTIDETSCLCEERQWCISCYADKKDTLINQKL